MSSKNHLFSNNQKETDYQNFALMNTLFSSCSIFQPLRATAESVADTCSSKVVLFCVTLYVNWFPSIGSPITNQFSPKHNIIIPKVAMPIPIFFFTICPSINSDLQYCLFPFSDLRSESSERSNRIDVNELVNFPYRCFCGIIRPFSHMRLKQLLLAH